MFHKRGQVAGQIFVYIAGIIIISMIIFFGLRIFSNVNKTMEKYVSTEFQNKIKSDVNSLVGSSGSYSTNKYTLPNGFNEICFVDINNAKLSDVKNYPIILDSVKSGSTNNVFLFGPKNFGAFYVDNLGNFENPYITCSEAISSVSEIKLFSLGDVVFVNAGAYKKFCEVASKLTLSDGSSGCTGLDIAYYVGYKQDCCDKYAPLCC